jgi:uncharacterized protein
VSKSYNPRIVDQILDEYLASAPAVLLVGPRASGKTTTAVRRAKTVLRLDKPEVAAALRNDPDAVLASCEPLTAIDEWQLSPSVLGAVKRDVDANSSVGRFLLTGSSRADLQHEGWPATGRVLRVPMWPMSVKERIGDVRKRSIIDILFEADFDQVSTSSETFDVRSYTELALRSGFPDAAMQQSDRVRKAWLASYVEQIVLRDAPLSGQERDPQRLRAYLQAIAANSAEVVNHKLLYDTAKISRMTGLAYDGLLESLFVTERLPPWSTNRLKHIGRTPKRHLVEPGLLGPLLRVDERIVVRDSRLVGALMDSFVVAQFRPELDAAESSAAMFHLRFSAGQSEVDLLLEGPAGKLVAIEIKASAAPDLSMAKHLRLLRDTLPDRFALGVVFHTGSRPFVLDDRIWALPISTIWA